jgi:3-isopropylmalate/(R)-2-methylmalate dehydratase large subunit
MEKTLYEKVFDLHAVREVSPGQCQLAVDRHLVNEVSSPQAFEALRERGLSVAFPRLTYATSDHSVSTSGDPEECDDDTAAQQVATMRANAVAAGIRYFDPRQGEHGIIHVVAPERGIVHPGMLVVCGDSHTSTYGAFGALAFGIGTTQVRDVLGTQTLLSEKLKVRRIDIVGQMPPGVYSKDVALYVIRKLGARAGVGYAYEFGGPVIDDFSMEERMTLCNLAVEGGARCGYINPDATTIEYLRGREYAPRDSNFAKAADHWLSFKSDDDANYDDVVPIDVSDIAPIVTWGISPDQSVFVDEDLPASSKAAGMEQSSFNEVLEFMGMNAGQSLAGTRVDVAFIGSCTNGRLSDLEAVADLLRGRSFRVAPHVRALVVPGSRRVFDELVARGLEKVFVDAGFEVRGPGCSLCCGMNEDRLTGREVCASSSNRNFKGRQGSPDGRTLLMSPVMVAAAAIAGEVVDARDLFAIPQPLARTATSMPQAGDGL